MHLVQCRQFLMAFTPWIHVNMSPFEFSDILYLLQIYNIVQNTLLLEPIIFGLGNFQGWKKYLLVLFTHKMPKVRNIQGCHQVLKSPEKFM